MSIQTLAQDEFNLQDDLVYLNHAAVAPWPNRTRQAVEQFARENNELGSWHYPSWMQIESQLRERIARLINATADDIALVKNTSEALSMVAYGLPWQAGDNIIISNQEFPSNRIVWESLVTKGVEIRQVDLYSAASPEAALINAMDQQTRLLSISSVQYASGLKVNLEQLGEHCRQHDILFCIDAIQSIGAVELDVQACRADFVMADGHKWMLGPEGLALFYTSPQSRDRLQLTEYGWHMVEQMGEFDQPDWQPARSARRFECGSPNMLCIHALDASLAILEEAGMPAVQQQIEHHSAGMMERIEQLNNLILLTDATAGRYAGIVTFKHRKLDASNLYRTLMENRILCAQRGGGIRYSPHFYTPWLKIEHGLQFANDCA